MNNKKTIALFAVAIMALGALICIPIASEDSAADTYNRTTSVTIAPGMSYTYTPTFPSDLNVTVTIQSQTSNWASLSNKTLTVNVPASNAGSTYQVVLKYTSSNPTQTYTDCINFTITSNLSVSGSQSNIVKGTAITMTPTASGMGTITWAVKSGTTLPAGLSLSSTSTGTVTGTPTSTGTNTIQLTATSSYGETKDLTVTFTVYAQIGTISGDAAIYTVAGTSKTSGAYSCSNATGWELISTNAPAGVTVSWDSSEKKITVSSASPCDSFSITLKATSSGGQEVTKTITVGVSSILAPSNTPSNGVIAYVA